MTYHFDEIIDRRNTNSLKWDVEEKGITHVGSGYGLSDGSGDPRGD